MDRLWRTVERVLGTLAVVALALLVGLPFLQVILRDFFSAPLMGLEEGTRLGLIALVYLGLPLLAVTNGHVRFAELVDLLPRRPRHLLERLQLLAAAVVLGFVLYGGLKSVLRNTGTRTPVLDIPLWLFALPFLLGLTLAALGALWGAFRRAPPETGTGPVL
jgi:TRAP-type C4-dicarboxylate transport system permease small subunit